MEGIEVPRYDEQRPLPAVRVSTVGMVGMMAVWVSWTVLQLYMARTLSVVTLFIGVVIFLFFPASIVVESAFHQRAYRQYRQRWESEVAKLSLANLKAAIVDPRTDEATAVHLLLHLRSRLSLREEDRTGQLPAAGPKQSVDGMS